MGDSHNSEWLLALTKTFEWFVCRVQSTLVLADNLGGGGWGGG